MRTFVAMSLSAALVAILAIVLPVRGGGQREKWVPVHTQSASDSRAWPTIVVQPRLSLPLRSSRLSGPRFEAIRAHLNRLVNRHGPRAALAWLQTGMARDTAVLRSCHALAHEIGHAAYFKYRNFAAAMSYQDDLCGSGYVHGVVEARLAGVVNVYSEMVRICAPYAATILSGKCYHGVGHGLMNVTHNDLPLSLRWCDRYPDPNDRIRCYEGVFMENFSTDQQVHSSRYLKPSDPLFPCAQEPERYKGSCYFYAPIYYLNLHYEHYRGALALCDRAPAPYVRTCVTGTGSRIEKQNIDNPGFVERLCATASGTRVDACIDGMVSYALVNYNSVRRAHTLCEHLQAAHRRACLQGVADRRTLFGP